MIEVSVPDWAKDAVWYQIFPERFRNGDPSNDPHMEDLHEGNITGWKIREWGSDWYSMDEWEKENYSSFFESVLRRRYGGDLQGIIDKLDYLQELGINAIYLNPVFRSPSLHKYDGSCFHHVDENFGPDPEGDRKIIELAGETDDPSTWVWTSADKLLLKLIKNVHERGMRIILDGVFNHSGRGFFAFQDILKNKKKSKYIDWYTITRWDESLPDGFEYWAWWGVHSLPEFRRDENGMHKAYKEYVFNITRRWMCPDGNVDEGIDGWRLDVAFCIPHSFWKEWRQVVKGINPDAYLTAEVVEIAPEFVRGDEFDAMMNYPFAYTVSEFFIDKKNRISVAEFDKRLRELRDAYPGDVSYVMQNLLSSHDSPRLRTQIVNPDMNMRDWMVFFERTKLEKNQDYRIDRGTKEHADIHKLITIFQMTYLGAPMLYYGDEVGMTGANDPDCRKPMLWEDLKYEDETAHPIPGKSRPKEKNEVDKQLLEHYKKLIKIRNENPALRRGSFRTILINNERGIYGFEREYEGKSCLVVLNNSLEEQHVKIILEKKENSHYNDILNDYSIQSNNEKLEFTLRPKWGRILIKK